MDLVHLPSYFFRKMKKLLFLVFALVGCGGSRFETPSFNNSGVENDAGSGGTTGPGEDTGTGLGGAGGADAGSGGTTGTAGEAAAGGAPEADSGTRQVPSPACCVDSECPASAPFCSPWGTCYQGGDPYNCDYDNFCESFCVHCSGKAAGACVVTSAPGAAHTVKSCVCS